MRKNYMRFLAAILLFCVPFAVSAAAIKYKKFSCTDTGVSMKHPTTWTQTSSYDEGAINFTFAAPEGTVQVDLMVFEAANLGLTLDSFVNGTLLNQQTGDPELKIKKKMDFKLLKGPAKKILTSTVTDGVEILGQQVYLVKNDVIYGLVLTSVAQTYKANSRIFDKMVKSFVIKK